MKLTAAPSGSTVSPGSSERAAPRELDGHTRDDLIGAYRLMLLSRKLDDKEIQLKNQSQIFFQISGAGHEAVLVAAGRALRPRQDWIYPYYRDRAVCLTLGVTPYDMLLQAVGAKDDPASGGRQMPSHWGHRELNIVSQSSPTGTQCLQAVGSAEASLLYERVTTIPGGRDLVHSGEITYVSIGEGTTSEGEFWESLNTACTKRLPLVILVEDNGYAISVPVDVQTPGGSISRLVRGFPSLHVAEVDGTDYIASARVMREAVEYARDRRGPALVHARVVRLYSHSLSDDERLYKPAELRQREAERDPIRLLSALLIEEGLATEDDLAGIDAELDPRDRRGDRSRAGRRETALGDRHALRLLSERRSSLLGLRSSGSARGASRTRWSPPSTAR